MWCLYSHPDTLHAFCELHQLLKRPICTQYLITHFGKCFTQQFYQHFQSRQANIFTTQNEYGNKVHFPMQNVQNKLRPNISQSKHKISKQMEDICGYFPECPSLKPYIQQGWPYYMYWQLIVWWLGAHNWRGVRAVWSLGLDTARACQPLSNYRSKRYLCISWMVPPSGP